MSDDRYAYFHTPDNTIAEMKLQRFDPTSRTFGYQLARIHAEMFGFVLIDYTNAQWSGSDWDEMYEVLETLGFYTRERQEELFDTAIVGTLDRIDL